MASALNTGVSGLVAHQRMLEVVGNNLANLNTPGYKVQRAIFSDLLYETLRPAAGGSLGTSGGINPNQVGSGVKVAQISRKFGQGNLELTGAQYDFAIAGDGLFVVNDGNSDFFTRAGTFSLDSNNRLVDPSTGFLVQRFGQIGESINGNAGIQTPGDTGVTIPLGSTVAGNATENVQLSGNLDARDTEAVAAILTSSQPLESGGSAAGLATLLNDLDTNIVDYVVGDSIAISGTDHDGSSVSSTISVDATTTVGGLVNAISAAFAGATASLDVNGNLVLMADNPGTSGVRIDISDVTGNAGQTNLAVLGLVETTEGKEADVQPASLQVIDELGGVHKVLLQFEKVSDNLWNLTSTIDAAEGVIVDGNVKQIQFNEDGSFQYVIGNSIGDATITFQFNGFSTPQTVDLDFSNGGVPIGGFTQFADESSVFPDPDGFRPGALESVSIGTDGVIQGILSNGETVSIAQLAIATFINPQGLMANGGNYYSSSLNSGEPNIGSAKSGGRGEVLGGQLESSNVDIASEFTRLIVAQRGFSANARTITIANEVLEELTNTIR